ncbi:MAG TPA: hypothetical protein VFF36_12875, partial [Planctomycetota bacterium]|nr:hypothetical protein [Planctomycetota bacterium]
MSGQASLFGASPEPAPPAEPTPAAASGRVPRAGAVRPRPTAAVRAAGNATPMMEQYGQAKREAGDALLFFRMGDFYELFGEDAKIASRALGITLTARSQGEGAVPMAGVPVKAYQGYLQQLIRAGFRVAICDQMEDPALAKGLVDRQVTRIVTAGTVFEDDLLERGASNYLLGLAPQGDCCGLAWLDVSTGAFTVAEVPVARVADEVARLEPAEIVVPESLLEDGERRWLKAQGLTRAAEWTFQAVA